MYFRKLLRHFIICIALAVGMTASVHAQKLSINVKDADLVTVFKEIKRQTGYTFTYADELVAGKRVTLQVNNENVREVLKKLFVNLPLEFEVFDKTVVVRGKEVRGGKPASGSPEILPIKISGTVVGNNGQLLAGATIKVKGKNITTTSDAKGYFELNTTTGSILLISYVGFGEREIKIQNSDLLRVVLEHKNQEIEEVIVHTGYRKIEQRLSTGAVDKARMKDIADIYSGNIFQKLEGNSPILFENGSWRRSMTIRGLSSINNSNLPLIVLDNFPYEGDLSRINPEDVEDITILKDAAAAAIWGARAGNGVIVITTKKGRYQSPARINVSSGLQVQDKPDLYSLNQISSSAVIDLEKFLFEKGRYKSSETSNSKPFLSPVIEHLIAIRDGNGDVAEHERAIEALRQMDVRQDYEQYMYSNAINQNHNISFEGSGNNIRYLFSGRFDQSISTLGDKSKNIFLRSFSEMQLTPDLKIATELQYNRSDNSNGRSAYSSAGRPYMMLVDEQGNALPHANYRTSFLDTIGGGLLKDWFAYPLTEHLYRKDRGTVNMLLASVNSELRMTKYLAFQLNYRFEHTGSDQSSLYGEGGYFVRNLVNQFSAIDYIKNNVTYGIPGGDILDENFTKREAHNMRLGLDFNKKWNNLYITALAGTELRRVRTEGSAYRYYGVESNTYTLSKIDYVNPFVNLIDGSEIYVPNEDEKTFTNNNFISQFVNASISFKDRYVLTGSARRDASNLFGLRTNEKWQPLWSIGYRWNITNEPFWDYGWIEKLSLRGSYGVSGNVDQSKSAITTIRYQGTDMFTNLSKAYISQYRNPELRWEKITTWNTGMEFFLFEGKLEGSADYYIKWGDDLFGNTRADYTAVPTKAMMTNVASMIGRGLDLSLSGNFYLANKFVFRVQGMLNINHSKITDYYLNGTSAADFLSNGSSVNGQVGYPVYSIMAYRWGGLDQVGNPMGFLNGKLSTDYVGIRTQDKSTLQYMGSIVPNYSGYLNFFFTVGNFDFSTGFLYKMGHVFMRTPLRYGELVAMGALGAGSGDFERRWQKPGDELVTDVPSFVYPVITNRNSFYQMSSVLVENASYIRFQNFTAGYGFRWGKRLSGKFYGNATNLGLVWKKNNKNIDPEYSTQYRPRPLLSLGVRFTY